MTGVQTCALPISGMGHTSESYTEPEFLSHLLGGIQMVAGVARFRCGAGR